MTPYFDNLSDFVHMGGHGVYVWLCWAIVFFCVIGLIIQSKIRRTRAIRQIKLAQSRNQKPKKRAK